MGSKFLKFFAVILFVFMVLVSVAMADRTAEAIEKAAKMNGAVVRLHKEGRIKEAVKAGDRTYRIIGEMLGLNHPSTATALHNLAMLFKEIGELERAEALFVRALRIRESTLGARHRDTISTSKALVAVQKAMGSKTVGRVYKNGGGMIGVRVPMANGGEKKVATKTTDRAIKSLPTRRKVTKLTKKKAARPERIETPSRSSSVPKSIEGGRIVRSIEAPVAEMEAVGDEEAPPLESRTLAMMGAGDVAPLSENIEFDEYKVKLGVDGVMKIPGVAGELRVWIGAPEYDPVFKEGMIEATGTLPAVGETAKVTVFAPAFEVEPKESICMKLHPTGSEVRFMLRPIKKGEFNVSADVNLYGSDDCSGTPIPKAVETLQVTVVVDKGEVIVKYAGELWKVFWEKFLDFWGAAVALFFGLILFLLRGKLKKIFGFGGDKS